MILDFSFRALGLLFILFVFGCSPSEQEPGQLTEADRWKQRAANVEIIRDDFGVPHIYGKTDADAVFGLLYAQCEDDFNRVERNYIWATGRLAEVEGERALYSDLRAKLYMTKEEAIVYYEESPEWLQKLCVAFADGINYYLETHPDVRPKLLTRFEPWMPMYFSEGSIGGDIERVSTSKIKDFYSKEVDLSNLAIHDGMIRLKDDEPRGSNGLAISGNLTQSGKAMLLINPHTSFFFRGEAHMVSEEGLNAYGAFTWGQFFIYQGFNEKTGWMHTSTGTDIIDEFAETIVKDEKGLHYKYGEELRPVDSVTVSLNYKDGEEMKSKSFKMYRTHHGPVTHAEDDKWIATALMWNPSDALVQSYTRIKQSDREGFNDMMDIRTNSSNNTVYADADGNIAYYHGNFIPKRDTTFDYTKPVDGSNPKTDWQGLHTLEENIFVMNPENGWIQNCNSTPFTSALEHSPKAEDYPKYMTSFPENYRGVHAIDLLSNAKDLTLDGLIKLAYDPYLPGAKVLVEGIIEAYEASRKTDEVIGEAIEILKNWDYKVNVESKSMSIAHYYAMTYRRSGKIPRGVHPMPQIEYMSRISENSERLKQFGLALEQLKTDFGSINIPWGEINRYQRNNGNIRQQFDDNKPSIPVGMASGYWGALASYGARKGEDTKRIYGVAGNSFVAVVEFGEQLKAKTLLAGGQSGDPDSPHFDDQVEAYAKAEFKDVAFYKEDVLKRAKRQYNPGE